MSAEAGSARSERWPRPACHHDLCFGCGPDNPIGLKLALEPQGDDRLVGSFALRSELQGPPSFAHGGILAAALDEAMSLLVHARGTRARTGQLEVRYHAPAAVDQILQVEARLVDVEGRRFDIEAEVRAEDGGELLATGRATFVAIGGDAP
jgi:acyl-coenzyme A thioesterase PaaI-like protein